MVWGFSGVSNLCAIGWLGMYIGCRFWDFKPDYCIACPGRLAKHKSIYILEHDAGTRRAWREHIDVDGSSVLYVFR